MPRLARIHCGQRQQLGCTTATAAMASAAAGATGSSGARPQRTGGMAKGLTELPKMLGARCRARFRALLAAVMAATWSAAAGVRPRRGYGLELANARGERGVLHGGSPRSYREGQWARGRVGVAESTEKGAGAEAWR